MPACPLSPSCPVPAPSASHQCVQAGAVGTEQAPLHLTPPWWLQHWGHEPQPLLGGPVGKLPCLPQLVCAGLHKAARAEFPVPGRSDAAQQSLESCWLTPCLDRQEPRAACQLPRCAHSRRLATDGVCAPSTGRGAGVGHTGVLLPEKVSVRACVSVWAGCRAGLCSNQRAAQVRTCSPRMLLPASGTLAQTLLGMGSVCACGKGL